MVCQNANNTGVLFISIFYRILLYSGPPLIRPPLQQALSWPYKAGGLCWESTTSLAFACKSRPIGGMSLARAEQNQSNTFVFKSAYGHFRTATNFRHRFTPSSHSLKISALAVTMLFIRVFPTPNSAANWREPMPFSCCWITLTLVSRVKITRFLVAIVNTNNSLRQCKSVSWDNRLPLANQLQARTCAGIIMPKQNSVRRTGKVRL